MMTPEEIAHAPLGALPRGSQPVDPLASTTELKRPSRSELRRALRAHDGGWPLRFPNGQIAALPMIRGMATVVGLITEGPDLSLELLVQRELQARRPSPARQASIEVVACMARFQGELRALRKADGERRVEAAREGKDEPALHVDEVALLRQDLAPVVGEEPEGNGHVPAP